MKKTTFLLFSIFLLPTIFFAQNYPLADTAKANALLIEGYSFEQKRQFDNALIKADSAHAIFKIVMGEKSIGAANALHLKGNCLLEKRQFDAAFNALQAALNIRLEVFGQCHKSVFDSYKQLSELYYQMGDYAKSIENDHKSLEIATKLYGTTHQIVAACYNNLGTSLAKKGDYNKSFDYHKNALTIRMAVLPPNHVDISVSLNNLANAYERNGDYEKSIEYRLKSMDIKLQNYDSTHPSLAFTHYGLGKTCYFKKDFEKAIVHFQKALTIRLKHYDETHPLILDTYINLGASYLSLFDYEKGFECLNKTLDISLKVNPNHPNVGVIYKDMSRYYKHKKEYEKATQYLQKAFDISVTKDEKASVLKCFADMHSELNNYAKADSFFAAALKMINFKDNHFENVYLIESLISILNEKAVFEQLRYQNTNDVNYLHQSILTYQNAVAALNFKKKSFNTEGVISGLQNLASSIYEGAINANLTIAAIDNNIDWRNNAFTYAEESKANLLQAQLKESDARQLANIPQALLDKDLNLKLSIAENEKERQQKFNVGKSETDSSTLAITSKLFGLRLQHDSLKQILEKNYPDYYRLKYDFSTIAVAEIQQKMLSPRQTLLSYFVSDSTVFAFVVRPDTFVVFTLKKDYPLESWVKQLRDGLYGYQTAAVKTEKRYEMKADSFAQAAFQLHQKLLTPLSILLSEEVIIVPDGVLGYIPFDVLLAEKPQDATRFNAHAYFGKKHIVSYNYSATLWQEMRAKKHKTEPAKNFIGFAPYYNGDTAALDKSFLANLALRKGLDSLKYSGEEVYKAQKLMQGDAILNENATKKAFESNVSDYRIVHLATHGKANDKVGDYCFLAFTNQKDSADNELLFVRDIYNLTLNADLVVLSACETGIGELKKGEGMVSLARAFAYAGAKSMVTSLWSVNDKSTMKIMETFYGQIRKGKTKDFALWQAKMAYLEKAKGEMAHPFFWSAFIPIGDMKALQSFP